MFNTGGIAEIERELSGWRSAEMSIAHSQERFKELSAQEWSASRNRINIGSWHGMAMWQFLLFARVAADDDISDDYIQLNLKETYGNDGPNNVRPRFLQMLDEIDEFMSQSNQLDAVRPIIEKMAARVRTMKTEKTQA